MLEFVILIEAKNIIDSFTYTSEILPLMSQNDVVAQPPDADQSFTFLKPVPPLTF